VAGGEASAARAGGGGGGGRLEAERQRALALFRRAAMVDTGLMCWEEGRREAVEYYRSAAELGHPVGMSNLGVSYQCSKIRPNNENRTSPIPKIR
jgi:hypothetical protein